VVHNSIPVLGQDRKAHLAGDPKRQGWSPAKPVTERLISQRLMVKDTCPFG